MPERNYFGSIATRCLLVALVSGPWLATHARIKVTPREESRAVESNLSAPTQEATPKVLSAKVPPYTEVARAAKASGVVLVRVSINADGTVNTARAETGHPLLRPPAEAAAKQWVFSPATDGEKDREVRLNFTFVIPNEPSATDDKPVFVNPYTVEVKPPFDIKTCCPRPNSVLHHLTQPFRKVGRFLARLL